MTNTLVNVTFKSALASVPPSSSIVISGMQNYLSEEIYFNVSISNVYVDYLSVNIYVHDNTYLKQVNVNYFACITPMSTYVQVSKGNYRTLDLDSDTGDRNESFSNQTISLANAAYIIPGISGLQYYNSDGTINSLSIDSWIANTTLCHKVSIQQKNTLFLITITTVLISNSTALFPVTKTLIGYQFTAVITPTTGFDQFQTIADGDMFSVDNQLYFGIKGFYFTMEDSRLFLFDILNMTDLKQNLKSNSFMNNVTLSVFVIANRACAGAERYYVEGFTCTTNYTGLMIDATYPLCYSCDSTCNGCATVKSNCTTCFPAQFRSNTVPGPCLPMNKYADVGKDICVLCQSIMPGCSTCSSKDNCTSCTSTAFGLQLKANSTINFQCACLGGRYMVSGLCLDYPGCISAITIATGPLCANCSEDLMFKLDILNNSSCKCKTGYDFNSSTQACEDKCGDGITPQGQDKCDDNNTVSGDGCSSTCVVQYGYVCSQKVSGGVSTCAQKQQITITYLYTQRNLFANQGTLVFQLLPKQQFLPSDTFQNNIVTNIPYTSKKITFDASQSYIYMTIQYDKTLQDTESYVNITFTGLDIYSDDINLKVKLNGFNAKLTKNDNPSQNNLIFYICLAVSGLSLLIAYTASVLGQKMMGIQLILPVQAGFFAMATFPQALPSTISSLWAMKFSNGYNSLQAYDLSTNYMMDPNIAMMQYAGQYILNYNIMFILLAVLIILIGCIMLRISWLERQQKRYQGLQKKKEQDKLNQKAQQQKKKQSSQGDEDSTIESSKQKQVTPQNIQQELQDTRQNMKNWKNFTYMLFDRFFAIFVVTAMMKIVFCFYIQLSNLKYTAEVYDNSLNAGFFFLTYVTIIAGLYAIVYDYKSEKLIVFNCNKGKYAMIYITIFICYITVLGAVFQSSYSIYIVAIFSILPFILIPYQIPYGLNRIFQFETIIALICQLPFLVNIVISLMLTFSSDLVTDSVSFIFAYAIIGSAGLSTILTIIRMIKVIDCKKLTFFQFSDRKKDNSNDKNKKKNKVTLLELGVDKDYDQVSYDSVRSMIQQKRRKEESDAFNIENKNKEGYELLAKKNELKKVDEHEDEDEEIDELEKIKMKLRKQLKQKKNMGKIK